MAALGNDAPHHKANSTVHLGPFLILICQLYGGVKWHVCLVALKSSCHRACCFVSPNHDSGSRRHETQGPDRGGCCGHHRIEPRRFGRAGASLSGRLRHLALSGRRMAGVGALCPCSRGLHPPDHALADRTSLADLAMPDGGVVQRHGPTTADGTSLRYRLPGRAAGQRAARSPAPSPGPV